jgi:hypothetical protein
VLAGALSGGRAGDGEDREEEAEEAGTQQACGGEALR